MGIHFVTSINWNRVALIRGNRTAQARHSTAQHSSQASLVLAGLLVTTASLHRPGDPLRYQAQKQTMRTALLRWSRRAPSSCCRWRGVSAGLVQRRLLSTEGLSYRVGPNDVGCPFCCPSFMIKLLLSFVCLKLRLERGGAKRHEQTSHQHQLHEAHDDRGLTVETS